MGIANFGRRDASGWRCDDDDLHLSTRARARTASIEITETHITDVMQKPGAGLAVKLAPDGSTSWHLEDGWEEEWHPIPRYLYDAIMRHHREVGS